MGKRSRKVNICIKICFEDFHNDVNRYKGKSWGAEEIRKSEQALINQLFGMELVGAMDWKDFIILRARARRITNDNI